MHKEKEKESKLSCTGEDQKSLGSGNQKILENSEVRDGIQTLCSSDEPQKTRVTETHCISTGSETSRQYGQDWKFLTDQQLLRYIYIQG